MISQMIVLADFSVIKPSFGLLFWTTVIFALFWFLIGKLAFKPIAHALKNREDDIQNALSSAEEAKREVAEMKSKNDDLLRQASIERSNILKEAKEARDKIVNEAKSKAKEEASMIIANAKKEILNEKDAAIREVKNEVGNMAITIAEKILKKELSNDPANTDFVNRIVDDMNMN
jgi:F-type H+-transporting ATPase subunit b